MNFCICFSYELSLYDQNDGYNAIYIEFGDVGRYEWWVWVWSNKLESWKYESKFAYLIVVIFGMKCVYKVMDDLFISIYDSLDAYLGWPQLMVSWSCII